MKDYEPMLAELVPESGRNRVWLFFVAFSRFEYALKRSDFADGDNSGVDAAWDRFASANHMLFQPDATRELRTACDYFINHPPKKQVLNGTDLDWRDSHPLGKNPLLCWLVTMIKRVRNNLFHGGKFPLPTGSVRDAARDAALIEHSLTILAALVSLDNKVRNAFLDPTE